MAATAGFDTLYVDVEHNGFSWDTTGQICMAALAPGITPFVRVPTTAPEHIAAALNGGALGVIAPHVRSADDARRVVTAAKFPPLGERGAAGTLPHFQFRSFPASQADPALNDATMVILMMETLEALEHVEEIAAVDGIDVLWVGHFDLSNFMGMPAKFNDPRFDAALRKVADVARKHHKAAGFMATDAAWVARVREMGYTMIAAGTDSGLLEAAMKGLVVQIDGSSK
jgi:2-keto-3-deoxy-L-rhamnonate aldolase RhmA